MWILLLLPWAIFGAVPIIDISALLSDQETDPKFTQTISEIGLACRMSGFFYIKNHNISQDLIRQLEASAISFFALDQERKDAISMKHGGKAWRGYFRNGAEVTSGIPDQKEGLYFGKDHDINDPRPLHGLNLWPADSDMHLLVPEYMNQLKALGTILMSAIAKSLGLSAQTFGDQFQSPTELFRIFNYPPHNETHFPDASMGVGEHTDYGYVTILWQGSSEEGVLGGLQVRSLDGKSWVDVANIPGTFVINLGDALEHNTGGLLRATPHRVFQRVNATKGRLSFAYFFDPNFDAIMQSVKHLLPSSLTSSSSSLERSSQRWDNADPALFQGTYGDYLLRKVSKAFPQLAKSECIISETAACSSNE